MRFEENIAADLDNFLTAVEEGWDEDRQAVEWIIYFNGVEIDRVWHHGATASAVLIKGGYQAKAERVIKRMWEETP